jgi:cystathionine beta-lyase
MSTPVLHKTTRLMHAGAPAFADGSAPVNVPVERTSTVRFENTSSRASLQKRREAGETVSTYGRDGRQTHRALEAAIGELEGARDVLLAPSGLSAISLVFISVLSPGDHVLVHDGVYGPVRERVEPLLTRLGVAFTYFSAADGLPRKHIQRNTKLIYAESPSSFLYEILDLPALADLAHEHGALLAADNTWGAGLLYQPLALGADISIQAVTKYLGGHSDLMQGAVSTIDEELGLRLRETHHALGLSVSADDAYLALRGIRTLPVRLAQHARGAFAVATYLQRVRAVTRVFHPALATDPAHALWSRDFHGANGLVSFALRDADAARGAAFIDALKVFGIGASWGGYESLALVAPPQRLSGQRYWPGTEALIRLHVGLEDADDLILDLAQAFRSIAS